MGVTLTYLNERGEAWNNVHDSATHQQVDTLHRLYNHFLGPVTSVRMHRPELSDLSIYSCSCAHTSVRDLMPDLVARSGVDEGLIIPGGGKGVNVQQSLLGALGELAERLLAVLHFGAVLEKLPIGSYSELVSQGRVALGPDRLPLFSPEQYAQADFPYAPFTPDTPLRWIEGIELLTGTPIFAPAQLLLMYYRQHPDEVLIGYPTSGGLAFHTDREQAILHAVYEVAERDAINLSWYSRIAPSKVDVDIEQFLSSEYNFNRSRLSTHDIPEIGVWCNTLDLPVPIFTAIAIDRSRTERAFLGGGGSATRRELALGQALFELGQTRISLRGYQPTGMKHIRPETKTSELTDFFDSAIYYGYSQNIAKLDWYLSGARSVRWDAVPSLHYSSPKEEYGVTLNWIHEAALNPIVFDFGSACWPGTVLVKVLIPELTQASVPSHPYLGHPRYYKARKLLNVGEAILRCEDLNTDPMPFP
jgi:ribosomal protein S12 methylthiotransferase accessory factor